LGRWGEKHKIRGPPQHLGGAPPIGRAGTQAPPLLFFGHAFFLARWGKNPVPPPPGGGFFHPPRWRKKQNFPGPTPRVFFFLLEVGGIGPGVPSALPRQIPVGGKKWGGFWGPQPCQERPNERAALLKNNWGGGKANKQAGPKVALPSLQEGLPTISKWPEWWKPTLPGPRPKQPCPPCLSRRKENRTAPRKKSNVPNNVWPQPKFEKQPPHPCWVS